jgi:hypothetical protein
MKRWLVASGEWLVETRRLLPFFVFFFSIFALSPVAHATAPNGAKGAEDDPLEQCPLTLCGVGANGGSGGATWAGTLLQDTSLSLGSVIQCSSASATACTWSGFLPTTANSGFAVTIATGNNVTIPSITWSCGGTWTYNSPHLYDSTNTMNITTAYNTTNTGGCTSLTINVSGAPGTNGNLGAGIFPDVVEVAPPSGATISVDQVSTQNNSSCSSACTLPPFNSTNSNALTATDAVVVFAYPQFTTANVARSSTNGGTYNAYTSPYMEDYGGNGSGNGVAFNAPAGSLTGTAEQCSGGGGCPATGYADFTAIAFKSSLGSFTVSPSAIWTPVNMQLQSLTGSGTSCSPSCSLTIQSTAGSDAFVVWVIGPAGDFLSSCSLSSTNCTVPTGAGTCQISQASVGAISCGYITSDPSGVTTLSITMTASATYYFGAYEISKSGGSISLAGQGSTSVATATNTPTGQAVSLSAGNYFVFQAIAHATGTNQCIQSVSIIPFPYQAWTNCTGQVYGSTTEEGAVGFVMNVASAPAPTWSLYDSKTSKYVVAALVLK